MRSCLRAGFFLLMLMPTLARAQVSGEVLSIGFDNYFRPDCWTPMVVSITADTDKSDYYQIRVRVQDMDRDQAVYMRTISVTGQTKQVPYACYFMPPPVDGSLPDATDPNSKKELQDKLKVSLHNMSGKWICDLPITTTVHNVDRVASQVSGFDPKRGAKLVVAVAARSHPTYCELPQALSGVLEDVSMVNVRVEDLPEKSIGYDAVDAIVWCDADPNLLKSSGGERFKALQDYVRRGGKLIICQPFEGQSTLALGDMLPVTNIQHDLKDNLMPLTALARPKQEVVDVQGWRDPWALVNPPFPFARAVPKSNAVVNTGEDANEMIVWGNGDRTPYIVRMPYGLGCVTWVAQDLGDERLKARTGWVNVWQHVFDWPNDPRIVTEKTDDKLVTPFAANYSVDFGKSLVGPSRMDLQSKSAWLITLAVLFFIGYWVVAGPGVYTVLVARKKSHLSWFAFGLCALAATGLTILIVRLVLRGPPELRHFSIVKMTPNEPAVVISRFGLYIPRDGNQQIDLKDADPDSISSISPLPIHPAHLPRAPDQTGPEYIVPVAEQVTSTSVPYRSTLKKFQATWVGQIEQSIRGKPKLVPGKWIGGTLINGTGNRLQNVYIAFSYPPETGVGGDWMLYVPNWEPGTTMDLEKAYNVAEDGGGVPFIGQQDKRGDGRFRGKLNTRGTDWYEWWFGDKVSDIRGGPMNEGYDDSGSTNPKSLPIMSFFDRFPPLKNTERNLRQPSTRVEILRRGGRILDMSGSLSAGNLVVIATAEGPIPIPLEVEGDKVTGTGTIFYQVALPLDRSAIPAATQPTTAESP
jgi:hypothetical protein